MLLSSKALLKKARAKHYAVPAFNINNLEMLKAVLQAAIELRSPLIVQTSEGALAYAGLEYLVAMVKVAAKAPIPVVLHLDHGKDLAIIKQAIEAGYTSVMFDGSALLYGENIAKTKTVMALAHRKRVSVEAELGVIRGIEDFVSVSAREAALTNPAQAADFVRLTKCDSLAIAVGTAHGAFKCVGECRLDLARLKEIAKTVSVPLVLHGASGIREDVVELAERHGARIGEARGILDEDIQKAIKLGVAKINIDTDLRLAFTAGVREALHDLPSVIDPRKILEPASHLITEVARQKIHLFRSAGKA